MTPIRVPAYHNDSFAASLEAEVLDRGIGDDSHGTAAAGASWVLTSDTILYPGGGGQPADNGAVAGVAVLSIEKTSVGFRHVLASPLSVGASSERLTLALDWTRRFDHMQQHTAQHLLSAIAQDRYGWATTAFHLGADRSDIELDVASLSDAQLARLEEDVMQAVREGRPVTSRLVSVEEYKTLPVRTRGLPEGHSGDVRLIEIEGYDLASCGGTHLATTSQIRSMKLLGVDSMRGGTRLHWVAGGRVRARLAAHEERAEALRRTLGASDEAMLQTIEGKVEQLKNADRRVRWLEDQSAASAAEKLIAEATTGAALQATGISGSTACAVLDAHFDGLDAGFLRAVSQHLQRAPGAWVALLTAEVDGAASFVLVAGADASVDLKAIGAKVAELLGGRGGGAGRVFQGKAGSLEKRVEAVAAL